ncbi:hypothetical protein [Variovorax sp.]|uniref:hypothetical protein n=1 Tax=Variovorax sp. TaxID=1871043 RepID=UPI0025EA502B|nr:hypothetical protein [Variovorax sp.]
MNTRTRHGMWRWAGWISENGRQVFLDDEAPDLQQARARARSRCIDSIVTVVIHIARRERKLS